MESATLEVLGVVSSLLVGSSKDENSDVGDGFWEMSCELGRTVCEDIDEKNSPLELASLLWADMNSSTLLEILEV